MNKSKSTTIEPRGVMLNDIDAVWDGHLDRAARPGEYKVYRKGDKIYLEVFHND